MQSVIQVVGSVVEQLTPLSSEERLRVIQAVLALLGEKPATPLSQHLGDPKAVREAAEVSGFPPRVGTWMRQNQILPEQLENVFHKSEDGFDLIASEIPGKTNREKVRNAYVLLGLARFLYSGEGKFDDKPARALCERYGFFDSTNHMKYMKGSEFAGTKDKGWTLTAPGLKRGAALIKEIGAVAQ